MDCIYFFVLCLSIWLCSSSPVRKDEKHKDNKLLLILLDGFRWDYINYTRPGGGFKRFVEDGVQAEYMDPLYPSESYPGYYAIATGLYGESHGIPLNYMYDKPTNAFFKMMPYEGTDLPFWWEEAEPLWVTTTRQNIATASFLWPGGHVSINGIRPAIFTRYERKHFLRTFHQNLDRALKLFATDEIKYAQVYCEYTDIIGHSMGPDLVKGSFLNLLDGIIGEMLDGVTAKGLDDRLNVVIVSDHGMTETDHFNVVTIELDNIITHDEVDYVLDRGSHVGIYPALGHEQEVYMKLKGIKGLSVYTRDEIPERYHLKRSQRVPPIFVQAHKGYYLSGLKNDDKQVPRDKYDWQWYGFHGYDTAEDPDMRGVFFARGPDFKKNLLTPPIDIVDPYNLLATLLGIEPIRNNGSWSKVKDMLI